MSNVFDTLHQGPAFDDDYATAREAVALEWVGLVKAPGGRWEDTPAAVGS